MDLKDLYEMQKVLDGRIEHEHPRTRMESRLNKKLIAFLVELSEMLNEKRTIFKFWSDKGDNEENALIEYVDGLHFLISIGLEINLAFDEVDVYVLDYQDIEVQVLELYHAVSGLIEVDYEGYERALELYLGLGEMLGFNSEQIEMAYRMKNKVNHQRQAEGY